MLKIMIYSCLLLNASMAFSEHAEQTDPLEDINRFFYEVNFNILDPIIVKPVAVIYDGFAPKPVRTGLRNFFSNLDEMPSMVNNVLQGKFSVAGNNAARFVINSTFGLAGIIDVAKGAGIPAGDLEDFGQTLAVWGVPAGPYLMLPFFGPSTVRDAPSNFIDSFLDPFTYNDNLRVRVAVKGIDIIGLRADLLGVDDVLSGDEYLFVKDVYLQNRDYVISDGAIEDDFDDLEDY